MRTLVLVDEIDSKNEHTLELLSPLRKEDNVVALCLTTMAGLNLRARGISYTTPDEFFSSEKWPTIDDRAYAISRGWHRSSDSGDMSYHGVSIGEALEYDFYHLLVAALRGVEIARAVLEDQFDEIHVPSSDARFDDQAISFQTACYEPLTPIISDLARRRGVKVTRLPPPPNASPVGDGGYKPKWDQGFAASTALFLLKNRRDLPSLLVHRKMGRVAITGCPICQDGIVRCLRGTGARGVKAFPGLLESRASKSHANRILRLLRDEPTLSKLDDDLTHEDIHFWRALHPLIDAVLARLIPLILARIDWTEHFVKRFRPDVFVVNQDIMPLLKSMCQVLKNRGVKVVVIQHGILTNDMAGMFVLPKVGDVQAVWGDYYRQWHTQRGKPDETQVATGYPRYDELVRMRSIDIEGIRNRHGLDHRKKVALVATEWYQPMSSRYTIEQHEHYIRAVLRALKAHDDLQIVVKLHPAYQAEYGRIVTEIASQEGAPVVVVKDSLWDLIGVSSFVIVSLSSVCLEALIQGKPVISVNMRDRRDISGLVQDGLAIGAYNEDELEGAIRRCIENPESCVAPNGRREELLLPFTGPLDGQAARRVAELVGELSTRRRG